MDNDNYNPNPSRYPLWPFVDGSVSISFSMLLALLLNAGWFDGLPLLGWLAEVTRRDNGVIIVATLLLFPCTLLLYGVLAMFFTAKEAVERRARRRARREERAYIAKLAADTGVILSPELARYLAGDGYVDPSDRNRNRNAG